MSDPPKTATRNYVRVVRIGSFRVFPGASSMFRTLTSFTIHSLVVASVAFTTVGCGRTKQDAVTSIALGQTAQSHGQHADAIAEFTRALLADPENAEALKFRAISYAAAGNEKGALNDLRLAIKARPEWADLWYQRALIHRRAGRNITAITDLNHALNLEQGHTSALVARGNLFWKMGDRDKALNDLKAAVESKPTDIENRRLLAARQVQMDHLKAAVANYSKILQADPKDVDAWLARSDCHNKIGQQQFALLDLNEAMKLKPDPENEMRYRRVHFLRLLERDAEVISELEAIARRDTEDMSLRREILRLAEKSDNHRAIVQASTELLRKQPGDPELYRLRGLANYRLRRLTSAVQDIGKAVTHKPDDVELRLLRARIQKENVEFLGLIHTTNQIIKRWPDTAEAYFLRAEAELELANESAAIRNLTDGLKYDPENTKANTLLVKLEAKRAQRIADLRAAYRRQKSPNQRALEAYDAEVPEAKEETASAPAVPTVPKPQPSQSEAETWSLDEPVVADNDDRGVSDSANVATPKPHIESSVATTPTLPTTAPMSEPAADDDEPEWVTIKPAPTGTLVGIPKADDPKRIAPRIPVAQGAEEPATPTFSQPEERTALIDVTPRVTKESNTDPQLTATPVEPIKPATPVEPPSETEVIAPELQQNSNPTATIAKTPAEQQNTAPAPLETQPKEDDPWELNTEPTEPPIVETTEPPTLEPALPRTTVSPTLPRTEKPKSPESFEKPEQPEIATTPKAERPLETYLIRGKHYREKRQFALAITEFTKAIRNYPDATELYIERSRAFAGMGEIKSALKDLRFVQDRNPGYLNGWLRLGELYHEAREYQNAVDVFSKIITKEPTNVMARVGRGRALNGLNDVAAARADLDVAVQTAPKNVPARIHRSYVATRMKHYDIVIIDASTAIELGSEDPDLRYRRGVALVATGKSEAAIDDLSVFLKAHPTNKHALAQRAHAYTSTKMHDAAIADWSEVIKQDSTYPEAHSRRALAFAAAGDHSAAIADFSQAIQSSPRAELYYERALAYRRLGNPTKAMQDLGTAIRVNPRYVDALEHRAMLLVGMGKLSEAIDDMTSAIGANPKRSATYYNRGVLFSRTGQNEKAIDDYNTALMLNNKLAACYLRRGIAHQKLGHAQDALADYTSAIELEEKLHQAFFYRAGLNLRLDNAEQAVGDFRRAIKSNPAYSPAWFGLAEAYAKTDRTEEAVEALSKTIALKADHFEAMNIRGEVFAKQSEFAKAEADFRRSTSVNPKFAAAWNNLARLRATCPDAAFRNPSEAIMFARKACDLTNMNKWVYLKTLANAYAEAGDFGSAQQWATRAESLAPATEKNTIRQLAELYRTGRTARQ